MTEKLIPGYGREILTSQDKDEFFAEAERRGHIYHLYVEGEDNPRRVKNGAIFQATSHEEAKQIAYGEAWDVSNRLDGTDGYDYDKFKRVFEQYFGKRADVTYKEFARLVHGSTDFLEWTAKHEEMFAKEVKTPPPTYPTHAYQLFYQGTLLTDYKPPNFDDVASGKVIMPNAIDVKNGTVTLPADFGIC